MVDPPWRFDPFQNIKTVHWGKNTPGFLAIGIECVSGKDAFVNQSWPVRLLTAKGAADFLSGSAPDGVTASPRWDQPNPNLPWDEFPRSRTFTVDLMKFGKDGSTFKIEVPPLPGATDSGTPVTQAIYYVVWLNENNGSTPDSPSQPIPSGMPISGFMVDGALDFGAVMAASAPDKTAGNRFIFMRSFSARVTDPWVSAGWQFDGERAVFADPAEAEAVAATTTWWDGGPPTYHVEQIYPWAPYAATTGAGRVNFTVGSYNYKNDIVLDDHNLPTSSGVSETWLGVGGTTALSRYMVSVSRGKLDVLPIKLSLDPPTLKRAR